MGHLGGRPTLASLADLRPADFRAWLAAQAARGVSRSTSARGLSVVRGFYRWLAKAGLVDNPAVAALKTPRVPRPVPKALTVEEARDLLDSVPESARAPWIGKRDPADKAKRLARVLVSDMIMYNAERHQSALAGNTLTEDFEEEIAKSWKEYVEQVGDELADGPGPQFWTDALTDILAKGEQVF